MALSSTERSPFPEYFLINSYNETDEDTITIHYTLVYKLFSKYNVTTSQLNGLLNNNNADCLSSLFCIYCVQQCFIVVYSLVSISTLFCDTGCHIIVHTSFIQIAQYTGVYGSQRRLVTWRLICHSRLAFPWENLGNQNYDNVTDLVTLNDA